MNIKIQTPYAINEIGKRSNNEDSIYPEKGEANNLNRTFMVCDGIGGYQGGEIASKVVSQSIASFLATKEAEDFNQDIFLDALTYAYDQLDAIADETYSKRMGTTLTFLHLHEKGAFMAHIGDSRIYHLRKEGEAIKILYKSEDHSYVNDLLKAGIITKEEADIHPDKNIITRAVQPLPKQRSEATIYETADILGGDYFFLCSDGILEQVDDDILCYILNKNVDTEEKNRMIFDICKGKSNDNFSSYLIAVESLRNTIGNQ